MIIAISGFQGSGKDTLSNIMVEKYGFIKLSFASIVKDVVSIIFGWDRKMLEGDTKYSRDWREIVDEWWANKLNIPDFSPRFAMQYIATDLFRNHFHPDIWLTCLERQLDKYENVVITDCRFPNEIKLLKNKNSMFIHIYRNKLPDWFDDVNKGVSKPPSNIHQSETGWINNSFDYTIENNGSIEDLNSKIKSILCG